MSFHLISVFTTEQFAHRLGCWVAGVLRKQAPGVHKRDASRLGLLLQDRPDTRRLEVVADGLPLYHGAQLAIDTTMASLRRDGFAMACSHDLQCSQSFCCVSLRSLHSFHLGGDR